MVQVTQHLVRQRTTFLLTDALPKSNLSDDLGAQALATRRRPRHPYFVVSRRTRVAINHPRIACARNNDSRVRPVQGVSRNAPFLAPIGALHSP